MLKGIIIAIINGDMKPGKTHKLVSAYSALATVALGLVAFDAIDRRHPVQAASLATPHRNSDSMVSKMIASVVRQAGSYRASLASK